MFNYQQNKQTRIKDIISVIKLSIIFFLVIIIFQKYFNDQTSVMFYLDNLLPLLGVVAIFAFLYIGWALISRGSENTSKTLSVIEYTTLFLFSCVPIVITGGYQSDFKFIFMLVIISVTIERGTKWGFAFSVMSSVFLLGADLISVSADSLGNLYFENDILLSFSFFVVTYTLGYYTRNEKEHIEMLLQQMSYDTLTGLLNHRGFHDRFEVVMKENAAANQLIALILIDIDDFKVYNEINSHHKGDEVLKQIGDMIKEFENKDVTVARYGGEEFALLVSNSTEGAVMELAEDIRDRIYNTRFEGQEFMPAENLTVSSGISISLDNAASIVELVNFAEEAMSKAKFLKKNSVVLYTDVLKEMAKDFQTETEANVMASIRAFLAVINSRDKYTYKHTQRVVDYCTEFAKFIEMAPEETKKLVTAAYLHDIGKINIPRDTLMKTTQLNKKEWEQLRSHPAKGAELVRELPSFSDLEKIVYQHHERYDGSGYPSGAKEEEIEYLSRVLSVADAFDAMTAVRPYKKRMTIREAREELLKCSGTQFDPRIVQQFVEMIDSSYKK